MDLFLYDRELRHERVKLWEKKVQREIFIFPFLSPVFFRIVFAQRIHAKKFLSL